MLDILIAKELPVRFDIDLDENWKERELAIGPLPSLKVHYGENDTVRLFLTLAQLEQLRDQLIMALPMVSADLGKALFDQACAMNAAIAQQTKQAYFPSV